MRITKKRLFKHLSKLAKSNSQETTRQEKKRNDILTYLNERLAETGMLGKVASIVRLDKKDSVCCYEHQINDNTLFIRLNASIEVNSIRYRPTHEMRTEDCYEGVLVRLRNFENCSKGLWVALINIPAPDGKWGDTIPFSPPAKKQKRA